jgi:hypothetical protein
MKNCQIRGVVGQPGPATPCVIPARACVSVEGLSPLEVCEFHARAMKEFWGGSYRVTRGDLEGLAGKLTRLFRE